MNNQYFRESKSQFRRRFEILLRIVGGVVLLVAAYIALSNFDKPAINLNSKLVVSQRITSIENSNLVSSSLEENTKDIQQYKSYCLNGVIYFKGPTTWHPTFADDGRVMICSDYQGKLETIKYADAFELSSVRIYRFKCVDSKLYVYDRIFKNSVMVPLFDSETRALIKCDSSAKTIGDIIDLRKM